MPGGFGAGDGGRAPGVAMPSMPIPGPETARHASDDTRCGYPIQNVLCGVYAVLSPRVFQLLHVRPGRKKARRVRAGLFVVVVG